MMCGELSMASYQKSARETNIANPTPTNDSKMKVGTVLFRSVCHQWRAAMTPQSHNIAAMFAASRSSQVSCIK